MEPEELCKHYSPSNHSERQLWDPLVFLLPRKRDSCPRGKGWKEGRWYTDEEERVLGIWSNPSIHLPTHTTACPSIHSVPRGTRREIVKTACCPLLPTLPPNTSLSLAGGYQQVWCMCYFYNRETIQLFKTPKAAKQVTKFRRGEKKRQKRGGAKPGSTVFKLTPEPQFTVATKYLARFSHLQFSHLCNTPVLSEDSFARECQMKEGQKEVQPQ